MNEIPEEQTMKVCEKLHLKRCMECCEGNHSPLSFYSREMDTEQYEDEWKRKRLQELIKDLYEPMYREVKQLRFSVDKEDYQRRMGK